MESPSSPPARRTNKRTATATDSKNSRYAPASPDMAARIQVAHFSSRACDPLQSWLALTASSALTADLHPLMDRKRDCAVTISLNKEDYRATRKPVLSGPPAVYVRAGCARGPGFPATCSTRGEPNPRRLATSKSFHSFGQRPRIAEKNL